MLFTYKNSLKLILVILISFGISNLYAQKNQKKSNIGSTQKKSIASSIPNSGVTVIKLQNPSFEDEPKISKTPAMWTDCGALGESEPDVQPSGWMVDRPAFHGKTYLGMVVRDNETWEAVGQKLSSPIQGGSCYEFSIYLSKSGTYISQSHRTGREANYTTPIKLRIWGGSDYCVKKELLSESSLVTNTRWIKYDFPLKPKKNHSYIVLEAFYNTPTLLPYNGNILLDGASDIVLIPCNKSTENTLASQKSEPNNPPTKVTTKPNEIAKAKETKSTKTTSPQPTPEKGKTIVSPKKENKILVDLDKNKIKEGQTIGIDKLYFWADSSKITDESYKVLDEIVSFLKENTDITIEVGGHTNNIPTDDYCDKLSSNRAKAVADYLINHGLNSDRVLYKGYGKRNPIATNNTLEGRKKNQRVEIKILSMRKR
ncbi:MAG: OmpA family protein [Saprospiraceae bacterium]|nr:OmpA family protein [Saprospiraceae bacterium]